LGTPENSWKAPSGGFPGPTPRANAHIHLPPIFPFQSVQQVALAANQASASWCEQLRLRIMPISPPWLDTEFRYSLEIMPFAGLSARYPDQRSWNRRMYVCGKGIVRFAQ
jgi:hypothetical protein